MAARTLPNLGLKAFFSLGEDGWNDEVDANFLKLSVLAQGGIINVITTKPGSPAEGSVYLMSNSASSNPNTIAVFDGAAWTHYTPLIGWTVFNRSNDSFLTWSGTAWLSLSLPNIRALGALTSSLAGVVEQVGNGSYTVRPVGVANATDLLTRASGDARFAALGHTHPASGVTEFNGRDGDVSLTSEDVTTALGFTPATSSPILTSLASLTTTVGLIEQTGANAFTKRNVGVGGPNDLPTVSLADARYQGIHATLTGVANVPTNAYGLLEQYAPSTFRVRTIGGSNDNDILSRLSADDRYVIADEFTVSSLIDVPDSYVGKARYHLTVKTAEDGMEFTAPGVVQIRTLTESSILALSDGGAQIRSNSTSRLTITIPRNSEVAFPIGTTIKFVQANTGEILFDPAADVSIDFIAGLSNRTKEQHGVTELVKYATNAWLLSGNLEDEDGGFTVDADNIFTDSTSITADSGTSSSFTSDSMIITADHDGILADFV